MPIYEYACKSCEHTLDALQKMSDEKLVDCPECGKPELKRLLSAPRFRLKGKGWYETDFKTDNQRNLASDKEPAKKSEKAESSKTVKAGSGESGTKESPKPKKDSKASTA
jgi:putative FmdB family regulatory protein